MGIERAVIKGVEEVVEHSDDAARLIKGAAHTISKIDGVETAVGTARAAAGRIVGSLDESFGIMGEGSFVTTRGSFSSILESGSAKHRAALGFAFPGDPVIDAEKMIFGIETAATEGRPIYAGLTRSPGKWHASSSRRSGVSLEWDVEKIMAAGGRASYTIGDSGAAGMDMIVPKGLGLSEGLRKRAAAQMLGELVKPVEYGSSPKTQVKRFLQSKLKGMRHERGAGSTWLSGIDSHEALGSSMKNRYVEGQLFSPSGKSELDLSYAKRAYIGDDLSQEEMAEVVAGFHKHGVPVSVVNTSGLQGEEGTILRSFEISGPKARRLSPAASAPVSPVQLAPEAGTIVEKPIAFGEDLIIRGKGTPELGRAIADQDGVNAIYQEFGASMPIDKVVRRGMK